MTDARTLTLDLGGRWFRTYGTAPCPVCQPERRRDQNALTLSDGTSGQLLVHCKKSDCAFRDILAVLNMGATTGCALRDTSLGVHRNVKLRREARKTADQARRYWQEALPVIGTPAEAYLRSRSITCPLPSSLRFHPACWHGPSALPHPALMARIEGGESFAIHRTYLRTDGLGKAEVKPSKMMLGAVAGGAVRLAKVSGALVVAEGIETALSLCSGILTGPASVWAGLSTSGLRGLSLPETPSELTIAADGDPAGQSAAHALAERAHYAGWVVYLLPAPEGHDWNDILAMKGERA